jgi:glycerate 2-kinase
MVFQPELFTTHSLNEAPMGYKICQVLAGTLNHAEAGRCINNHIQLEANKLFIQSTPFDLAKYSNIYVIAVGKAAIPMTEAIFSLLGNRINSGIVITKDGYNRQYNSLPVECFNVYEASHPIPDLRNIAASQELVNQYRNLRADDLLICLISGGGSALMTKPYPGISLEDLQQTSDILIRCGATISEINTVRKHLDILKGGGLAKQLYPAKVITLVLSDVPDDNLDMVASGPTIADPTTFGDAWLVFQKYQVLDRVPPHVLEHISDGISGNISETLKPGSDYLKHAEGFLVGNNFQVATAAVREANNLGFIANLIPITLHGEASQAGRAIAEYARTFLAKKPHPEQPVCLIAGGETTVTVSGAGKGGRNQEFALGAVKSLSSVAGTILISLATDGGDGPTDAAGAIATHHTYARGLQIGLDPDEYLSRNDSYNYFDKLDDLIRTGPTLTNMNDLAFLFLS